MIDPTLPSDPITPPYAGKGVVGLIGAEMGDHLWPWSKDGLRRQKTLSAAGLAAAVAATLMWVLAAQGRLGGGAIIGWWVGWSVFEVIVRLASKPYVKEGPWWGRRYRRAGTMDMICYVGFKNLLIGATLFVALKSIGLISV